MENQLFVESNGVNVETGEYLWQGTPQALARVAVAAQSAETDLAHLLQRASQLQEGFDGLPWGVDRNDLSQVGWGVIFALADENSTAIRDALAPLLAWRQEQAGALYRELVGLDGYRPNESHTQFLARNNAPTSGKIKFDKMPYYLLLVGDPTLIPFEFQYQLDVQHAVGRIAFDSLADYAQYAESVVSAEKNPPARPRRATFFSVVNPDDVPTRLSNQHLVTPLAESLATSAPDWEVITHAGDVATRSKLAQLLGGDETPALLFTASHGIGFPPQNSDQLRRQGALLCREWGGPYAKRPIGADCYFSADDVSDSAELHGLISFHFACYSAGTPQNDNYAHLDHDQKLIAPRSFIAALPKRLLSHPKGGALACIGHIDRAWGSSFLRGNNSETATFEDTINQILHGQRVGAAMASFNDRYAQLASDISSNLATWSFLVDLQPPTLAPQKAAFDKTLLQINQLWTGHNDARAYIILGDPAAKLP